MADIDWVYALSIAFPAAASFFSLVVLFQASGNNRRQLTQETVCRLLRDESDRIRLAADEHARGLRHELSENGRSIQEATITIIRELSDGLRVR